MHLVVEFANMLFISLRWRFWLRVGTNYYSLSMKIKHLIDNINRFISFGRLQIIEIEN